MDFLIIALVSVIATVAADFATKKTPIGGIDFMFYAPWAVALASVYNAVVIAVIILVFHALSRSRIAHYILLSFPAQAAAIAIGALLGAAGFWIALMAYFGICTVIARSAGALGGKYLIFVVIAVAFNILLYSAGIFL